MLIPLVRIWSVPGAVGPGPYETSRCRQHSMDGVPGMSAIIGKVCAAC